MDDLRLRVEAAKPRDIGRGIARVSQNTMRKIGISAGNQVEIIGTKCTLSIAWPAYDEDQDSDIIRIDSSVQRNAGVSPGGVVTIRTAKVQEDTDLQVSEERVVDDGFLERELREGEYAIKKYNGSYIPIKKSFEHKKVKAGIWYVTNHRLIFRQGVKIEIFPLNEMINLELRDVDHDSKVLAATFQRAGYKPERFGIHIKNLEELQEVLKKARKGGELPKLKFQTTTPASLPEPWTGVKRDEVLRHVIEATGFDFPITESDFSPRQRQALTELAPVLEKYESKRTKLEAKALNAEKYKQWLDWRTLAFVLAICVAPLFIVLYLFLTAPKYNEGAVVTLGTLIVVETAFFSLLASWGRKQWPKRERERKMLASEVEELWADYKSKINALANSIRNYVLTTVATRTDFGRFLRALKKKGVVLKTIECPNCAGILKVSEVPKKEEMIECRYCGKSILAMNLFEKFKDIIGV